MTNFAREIRDAAIERLKLLGRYAPRGRPGTPARIRRTPVMPAQADEVPCLMVYLGNQTMTADGDANAGEPSFVNEVQLVIASILNADDADDLDDRMADAGTEVLETLLEDPDWLALSEGVPTVTQQSRFDDSKYLAAIVMTTITVTYRTLWPPRVAGDFLAIRMRTPDGGGADYPVNPEA